MALQVALIQVTPFAQNCALIWDEETLEGAVIDPGGEIDRVMAAIERTGARIRNIFLTHGHLDHAGGAMELRERLGVKLTGPGIQDKFLLDTLARQGARLGMAARDCAPDAWLEDGDTIEIAAQKFEVLLCPGHTPGHVVYVSRALGFGMFGDVLFRNSIGRTDFAYGDGDALLTAIKTRLMVLPDEFAFCAGHGVSSTIGAERRSNPFLR